MARLVIDSLSVIGSTSIIDLLFEKLGQSVRKKYSFCLILLILVL